MAKQSKSSRQATRRAAWAAFEAADARFWDLASRTPFDGVPSPELARAAAEACALFDAHAALPI